MEHAQAGEGGVVLSGLYYWDRPMSVTERLCLGPQTQLRPLHVSVVSPQIRLEGEPALPWAAHTAPSLPP